MLGDLISAVKEYFPEIEFLLDKLSCFKYLVGTVKFPYLYFIFGATLT